MLCAWVLGMASTTAQANQATIFLLDNTNAAQVATAVLNTLQNNAMYVLKGRFSRSLHSHSSVLPAHFL